MTTNDNPCDCSCHFQGGEERTSDTPTDTEWADSYARDFCSKTPRMKPESGMAFYERLKSFIRTHFIEKRVHEDYKKSLVDGVGKLKVESTDKNCPTCDNEDCTASYAVNSKLDEVLSLLKTKE